MSSKKSLTKTIKKTETKPEVKKSKTEVKETKPKVEVVKKSETKKSETKKSETKKSKPDKKTVKELRAMCEGKGIELKGYVSKAELCKHLNIEVPKKKQKKEKDPNRPKKGTSAFFSFCSDHRSKVTKSSPDMKPKDVNRELGKMWKKHADSKDKVYKKYTEEYQKQNEEYKEKMSEYKKDSTAPKRPKTDYFMYADEVRDKVKKENPNKTISEIAKIIGGMWQKMDAKKKKSLQEKYAVIIKKQKEEYLPYANFSKATRVELKKTFPNPKAKGVGKEINKMIAQKWNEELEKNANLAEEWKIVKERHKKKESEDKNVEDDEATEVEDDEDTEVEEDDDSMEKAIKMDKDDKELSDEELEFEDEE